MGDDEDINENEWYIICRNEETEKKSMKQKTNIIMNSKLSNKKHSFWYTNRTLNREIKYDLNRLQTKFSTIKTDLACRIVFR